MPLTANRDVDHYIDQELRSFQVAAGAHIYKGSLLGLHPSGYARPLLAGDLFVGIAYEEMDNSNGANGDRSVRVYTLGDFGLPLPGAGMADIGSPVFAASDETLTFSSDKTSYVGRVQGLLAPHGIILQLETCRRMAGVII